MKKWLIPLLLGTFSAAAQAAPLSIAIHAVNAEGIGESIGHVQVSQSPYGLVFTPELSGLSQGLHGFHVHQNPSCAPALKEGKASPAESAGGHFDPKDTKQHGAPWDDAAHLGDLPALYVDADGKATQPVLAPRLKTLEQIQGRALMIHAGADNHADHPMPLGGGGVRMACGVIK